jgi:acetolactate synthase-1/2/3 large subunit
VNFNPHRLFVRDGNLQNILLIAGISSIGNVGGLYSFDGHQLSLIDSVPTAALDFDGSAVVRLLCSGLDLEMCSELLFYDQTGVRKYFRIDGLPDAHDLRCINGSVVCVATMANSILWISRQGEVERTWRAPGEKDSWHVNGVVEQDGKIFCTAFGTFKRFREWNEWEHEYTGVIYNISDEKVEIGGFDCPHSPLYLKEGWVLCNSGASELINIPPGSTKIKRRTKLEHWTRGLAATDDYFFVGESANRKQLSYGAAAHLAIVDRQTWELCGRIALPFTEVTSIALVPASILLALRRGFRTNSLRENALGRISMLQRIGSQPGHNGVLMEALPREGLQSQLKADVPAQLLAGDRTQIPVTIRNTGTGIWHSRDPHPVNLSCRWFPLNGSSNFRGQSTNLPRPVHPDEELSCNLTVVVPKEEGEYDLAISLVQEFVAWFDDVDPANGLKTRVRVVV